MGCLARGPRGPLPSAEPDAPVPQPTTRPWGAGAWRTGLEGWGARRPHPNTSYKSVVELCRFGGSPVYRFPSSCTPRQEERNFRRPDGQRPWPRGPPLPTRGCARGRGKGRWGPRGRRPRVRSARSCRSGARWAALRGGAGRRDSPGCEDEGPLPSLGSCDARGRPESTGEGARGFTWLVRKESSTG